MLDEFQELPGLNVEVGEVIYMPHLEAPPERPHPFVYFISILNDSKESVTIRGRKWILKDSEGDIIVVEGRGVVGEAPVIPPGERFSYNSYHVIKNNSNASGAFFGMTQAGKAVRTAIPAFSLKIPDEV